MSRLLGRVLAVSAALGVVALAGTPSPASAHATLVASTPTQGQHLDALPDEVSFEFNQDMSPPAYVIVTAPDGSSVVDGKPQVDGPVVRQAVTDGPEGTYTMAYRAVSEDGHPVTGEITFTVGDTTASAPSAGSTSAPTSAPSTSDGSAAGGDTGGSSHRLAVLVGVGLFAAAGTLLLASRRSGP